MSNLYKFTTNIGLSAHQCTVHWIQGVQLKAKPGRTASYISISNIACYRTVVEINYCNSQTCLITSEPK
jgi:hypothetical protein